MDPRTPQNLTRIARPPHFVRLFESSRAYGRSSIQSLVTPVQAWQNGCSLPAMQNHTDSMLGAEGNARHGDDGVIGNNREAESLCDGREQQRGFHHGE